MVIGKIHVKAALIGVGTAIILGVASVNAAEIDELKAQIEALRERLARLEASQKQAELKMKSAASAKAVVAGNSPGSWKVPGSDTSLSFGGFVKGDTIYDTRNNLGPAFAVGKIELDGAKSDSKDGSFTFHARQSRLRFDSHTATTWGPLTTRIETDFFGGGNVLRLRHAYGAVGGMLAGQTWSILMDEDTFASTVDSEGPVGMIISRKPQFRYTRNLGKNLTGQIAVEIPSGTILQAKLKVDDDSVQTSDSGDRMPNFLAALRYRPGWGAVNLSGVLREVSTADDSLVVYGFHAGAHVNVAEGTRLMATVNIGSGIAGYLVGGGAIATLKDSRLEGQAMMGGFVGITHRWTDSLRSGLHYGWVNHDTNNGLAAKAAATENAELRSLHANVFWSPVPRLTVGLEFMHGWREANPQVDGKVVDPTKATDGQASRIQLGMKYDF